MNADVFYVGYLTNAKLIARKAVTRRAVIRLVSFLLSVHGLELSVGITWICEILGARSLEDWVD